ncbi:MAG: hypothetical protein ACT4NL_10375, partial [Pseudomarimonas sp.]
VRLVKSDESQNDKVFAAFSRWHDAHLVFAAIAALRLAAMGPPIRHGAPFAGRKTAPGNSPA